MGDELDYGAVQGRSGIDGLVMRERLVSWLLDSDPALRWQVERDVLREPPEVWEPTRARVATEGFGARLLAHCRTPTVSGQAVRSFRQASTSAAPAKRANLDGDDVGAQ